MRIIIVGSGAMGSALATILCEKNDIELWCRREEHKKEFARTRINDPYLPGVRLPKSVKLISGNNFDYAGVDMLILAVPTQHLRKTAEDIKLSLFSGPVVNTAKGLELGSFKTPCEFLAQIGVDDDQLYTLSGPSHAEEMAAGVPTSVVLAGHLRGRLESYLPYLSAAAFRPYYADDRLGVELGGALKNIIAIACGVSDGMGFGMNTKSAILTRGLAEIRKYGLSRGARAETFSGLSCLGDLVTTCCSRFSRNWEYGHRLATTTQGKPELGQKVVEGAFTVKALRDEIQRTGIEMPLSMAVFDMVYSGRPVKEIIRELLNRPLKMED